MNSRTPSRKTGFDRIKPIVEKMDRHLRLLMQNRRLRGIVDHGVVSTNAPTPDRLGFSIRRLTTFNSNQTPNGVVRRPQKSKSTSRYPHPRVGCVKILERLDNIRGQTWAAVTQMPCRIVPLPPHTKRTLLQRRGIDEDWLAAG
jgi:hypothetical protein